MKTQYKVIKDVISFYKLLFYLFYLQGNDYKKIKILLFTLISTIFI